MRDSELRTRSKELALRIIMMCENIYTSKGKGVLVNQIVKSATSIGANIHEAHYGASKADFINKLHIALKECSESEYWLELLIESGYYDNTDILDKCIEIKKLLISSINTSKNKLNK